MTVDSASSAGDVRGVSVWQMADGSLVPSGALRGRRVSLFSRGDKLLKGEEALQALEKRFLEIIDSRVPGAGAKLLISKEHLASFKTMVDSMPPGRKRDDLLDHIGVIETLIQEADRLRWGQRTESEITGKLVQNPAAETPEEKHVREEEQDFTKKMAKDFAKKLKKNPSRKQDINSEQIAMMMSPFVEAHRTYYEAHDLSYIEGMKRVEALRDQELKKLGVTP